MSQFLMGAMPMIQGGIEAFGIGKQNETIEMSMADMARAADVQQRQVAQQASVDRGRRLDEAARSRGALRARGMGGSAFTRQTGYEGALDATIIQRNAAMQIEAIRSQYTSRAGGMAAQAQSPLLALASGALQSGMMFGMMGGGGGGGGSGEADEYTSSDAAGKLGDNVVKPMGSAAPSNWWMNSFTSSTSGAAGKFGFSGQK